MARDMEDNQSSEWEDERGQESSRGRRGEKEKEECLHLHISDFSIHGQENEDVVFRKADEESLSEFTEGILAALEAAERPMRITIDVLTRFYVEEQLEDMQDAIKNIVEAAMATGGRHRVTFSSVRFSPELEKFWSEIQELNLFIRKYTAISGEQPLNLMKIFLAPYNGHYVSFGVRYKEYVENKSLGRTPSDNGASTVALWVIKHHRSAYRQPPKPSDKQPAMLPLPLPLGVSADYTENPIMLEILKARGMFYGKRNRSASRSTGRRRTSHRTRSRERSDSMVSLARPRGGRSPQSINALERLLNRVWKYNNQDPEEREREQQKITGKVATIFKEKCREVTQLSVQLETIKLEYEITQEKKLKEMELECNELRQQNDQLRRHSDAMDRLTTKLTRMKEDLVQENAQLQDELQLLRMSKKERRAARKAAKKNRK